MPLIFEEFGSIEVHPLKPLHRLGRFFVYVYDLKLRNVIYPKPFYQIHARQLDAWGERAIAIQSLIPFENGLLEAAAHPVIPVSGAGWIGRKRPSIHPYEIVGASSKLRVFCDGDTSANDETGVRLENGAIVWEMPLHLTASS